jgi:hypothetical protein
MLPKSNKTPSSFARFCARLIDYSLFYFLGVFISFFSPVDPDVISYFYFALFVPIFFAPIDALWTSTVGTTAGKALFRIFIYDQEGKKLSFSKALKRSLFLGKRPGFLIQMPITNKRKLLSIAGAALVVFGGISGTVFKDFTTGFEKVERTRSWMTYYAEEAGFQIAFPKDPEVVSKELDTGSKTLQVNEFTSQTNNVFYSVSYMDFPKKWRWVGSKTLLKKAVDLIVQHTDQAELVGKRITSHKNLPAIDFLYKQGNDEVKGRLVLVNNRLFKLTIAYPSSLSEKLQQDIFLESFELSS